MQQLSLGAILEKNKIRNDSPVLLLLELTIPNPEIVVRVVRNNEDIQWNGQTWNAYNFTFGSLKEDGNGELPRIPVNLRTHYDLVKYLEDSQGAKGATVKVYVVHYESAEKNYSMGEFSFGISSVSVDDQNISIDLGADILLFVRYPRDTYGTEHCRWKYGGIRCGVSDAVKSQYPTCPHIISGCRERGNSVRFGSYPGIPGGDGIYV